MQCVRGGCPKCGGSLFPERNLGKVVEFNCLQCGKTLSREAVLEVIRGRREVPVLRAA